MSAPIEPDDPDARVHAAWLAQVSDAADGLVARQVPKQDGGSTSVSAISSNPAVRLVGHDAPPPQLPRLWRRSGRLKEMLHMEPSLEQRIRERAYEIWNATGREDGRADEHWLSAERELLASLRKRPIAAKLADSMTSNKPKMNRPRVTLSR